MMNKKFEEQFPSLNEMGFGTRSEIVNRKLTYVRCFSSTSIMEYCFDKQKVRDAIIKFRDNIFETGEMSKEDRAKLTIKFDILNDELGL